MKKDLVIYVEGESDKKLLDFLLNYWNIEVEKTLFTNGYTNLFQVTKDIINYNNKGIKVLILFDADSKDSTDTNNGFGNKIKYLTNQKEKLDIDFAVYLFPNDESDGMVEDFIRDISKYRELYDCWDSLWECVESKSSDEITFSKEGSKTMLYYYVARLFGKSKPEVEAFDKYQKNIDFSDEKWNLNESKYAQKLREYLEKI